MTRRRKLAILAVLSTAALVGMLLALEGGAYLIGFRPHRQRVYDAELGWTYKPGTVFQYMATGGRIHASVDSSGFRPSVAGREQDPALLCLGDSFTFGGESPDDRTWPECLARSLAGKGYPCRAVNRGITGYSPVQGLLILRRVLKDEAAARRIRAVIYT